MTTEILVSPTDLRDYAKSNGLTLLLEAARDRLYVMTNPQFLRRQLVFPMDVTAPDYKEAVSLVIAKLAEMERRSFEGILNNVLEVGDDAIAFRVTTPRADDASLPLTLAGEMLIGAQQLLLASACSVLKPQSRHPRLSRTEAQQLLEASRFRHTQPGSFVLNVSCPVHALDVQVPATASQSEAPFVRRATQTLNQSLSELVTAIETDTVESLVEKTKSDAPTALSSNLCEALMRFEDDSLRNSIEISITWAANIPRPYGAQRISTVRVQHDYFSKIEEVGRELRSTEKQMEDLFIGTVERLDGEMGENGKRSGEVVLSLFTSEGEQLRSRATLAVEQYALADKAHMTDGEYVVVAGKLHPGRQPRLLSDIRSFELMPK